MPYSLINLTLGVTFLLLWLFICGIVVGHGRTAQRRDSERYENQSLARYR
jgi:hypothetical protein